MWSCLLLTQSGHELVRCTCLLLTQSGHARCKRKTLVAREGSVDQGVEEMGLGTVTPPLGENTPGRRLDWFLRVLRGYRWGDHRWER